MLSQLREVEHREAMEELENKIAQLENEVSA